MDGRKSLPNTAKRVHQSPQSPLIVDKQRALCRAGKRWRINAKLGQMEGKFAQRAQHVNAPSVWPKAECSGSRNRPWQCLLRLT